MKRCSYPIESVVPHAAPMILLSEILDYDETQLRAAVTITDSTLFVENEGVPAFVGLEYMAQACGAFAGVQARDAGEPVKIGFLLGTRRFETDIEWFRRGQRLIVSAAMIYRDIEMGTFDCRIDIDDRQVASARLNVFQPRENPALAKTAAHE